jgi:hypothetical protein
MRMAPRSSLAVFTQRRYHRTTLAADDANKKALAAVAHRSMTHATQQQYATAIAS